MKNWEKKNDIFLNDSLKYVFVEDFWNYIPYFLNLLIPPAPNWPGAHYYVHLILFLILLKEITWL